MGELKPSAWAQERFGTAAADLTGAVARAIHQAHGLAMDAHVSGGLHSNDTYGATQHCRSAAHPRSSHPALAPEAQVAELDPEQLEAELAEGQAVLEQLAKFGQVVTVGFASNPALGLFDLGWGEAELVNPDTGEVRWYHWEQLPPPDEGGAAGSRDLRSPLRPAGGPDRSGRFDDAPLTEDFGLTPRSPAAGPPSSEPQPSQEDTGSDDLQ